MPKHEPQRTCIVTREAHPDRELMRFVLGPGGEVVPDLRRRLPGRGAWVRATAAAVGEAVRKRLFAKGFKAEAKASPDLVAEIDALLVRDVAGALALANKAGAVVAGFAKVESALAGGGVAALVHAREAAEDGRRKLAAALRRNGRDPISAPPVFDDLPGDDLAVALGRDHVVHAALLAGPGSEGCLARWRRLRVFRGVDEAAEQPRDMDQHDGDSGDAGCRTTIV